MSLITTPATLLRSFNYSETSRILKFSTREFGVVSAMAKGIRAKGGKSGSALDTFASGSVTLVMRSTRDLQTFREFAVSDPRRELASSTVRFGAASVLAELVLLHGGMEPNPTIYDHLENSLDAVRQVEDSALVSTLLMTAWTMVAVLGYRPVIDPCIQCGSPIPDDDIGRLDYGAGGLRCQSCSESFEGPRVGPIARLQLAAFLSATLPPNIDRPRAHLRILADFVTYHVSHGSVPRSFRFLEGLLPPDRPLESSQ